MKRLFPFFVLIFCFLVAAPILAQDVDLNADYTSENEELSFSYPDGWEIDDQNDRIYVYPDADNFPEIEDVGFSFLFLTDAVEEEIGVHPDMSAEEAMEIVRDGLVERDNSIEYGDIVLEKYGDNDAALLEFGSKRDYVILAAVKTETGLIMAQVFGAKDEVDAARDIFFEIIASVVLGGDSESSDAIVLSETYTNESGTLTFSYPEGWEINDDETEIYVSPNSDDYEDIEDVIITFDFYSPETGGSLGIEFDDSAGDAALRMAAAIEDSGRELETFTKTTIGVYTVVILGIDEPDRYYFAAMVRATEGLILVELEGPKKQVNAANDIFFAMIQSIEYVP